MVVVLGNLGLPVPEETVLALAGYLVWSGHLQLVLVLIVGIISAVAGNNLGYWLGHRTVVGPLRGMRARCSHRRGLQPPSASSDATARSRSRLPRFVSGTRFLAGPLSGAIGLPFGRFLTGNLIGAVLFVPYAVGLGYAIGYGVGPYLARLEPTARDIERLALAAAVIALASVVVWGRMPQRIVRWVARAVGRG